MQAHRFNELLSQERVIIYFLVDWSGPERISRSSVTRAVEQIGPSWIPVVTIDSSELGNGHVVMQWLRAQQTNHSKFRFEGWGDIVLVEKGVLVDFILNPGSMEFLELCDKLKSWTKPT